MTTRVRRGLLDALCIAAVVAAAVFGFWTAERRIAGVPHLSAFPLDDAWIHLQFARNLAEGHGFSYNPGVPVAGSTAPLWTLALAAAFRLDGTGPAPAKILGMAAALGAALVTRSLVRRWTGSRALALAAGITAAVSGPIVWGALSGMEVALAALLVSAALLAHGACRDRATALLLGLAALTRPESLLLVPLVWLAGPVTARRTALLAAVLAALLGPWAAFNLLTAGTPLPATATAKVEGGLVGLLSGAREPWSLALYGRPWQFELDWVRWLASADVMLPLLLAPGLWGLWRSAGRRVGLPALVLVLHPLGMAWLAPYRPPGFQEGRYSTHLLPLAIAVAFVGAEALSRLRRPAVDAGEPGRRRRGLLRFVLAGALVAGAAASLPAAAVRYAWAVENIEAMQVHLGRWLADNTPSGAVLAVNDVGAIAYFSGRPIVDVMGLVTPAIIPYRRRGEAGVLEYLERARPAYLVVFPAWFPELTAVRERFTPIYRIRLEHNTVAGADEMVVYRTPWTAGG